MNKPAGVIVIAILYFIGAALCLVGGLLFIAGGGFLATVMSQSGQASASPLAGIMAGLGAVAGIICLALGVIDLLVGIGLVKLKNWARIVAIVFSAIGAAFQLLGILSSLSHFNVAAMVFPVIFLGIYALIIWYLLKPEVKAAFQGAQVRAASA
jgi:hypothetical protein